uniref:Putative secreted histamine binding protein of 19.7 kDa n=1 Tax=Ixodes pacificus TaxID=29930 RepID=Q6B8D0_IXOPA|nr:putative secreted histamine binding protein of 19.7 kDa [Ixodes pacificus]
MSLYSIALATFLVGISHQFGLSSTVISTNPPYEDDPQNFEHQHATGFLCSNSTYYMLNRTYTPQPPSECISVNVTSGLRNGTYQALLKHRFNGSSEITSLNVTVQPFTSGLHTEDNALFFKVSVPQPPLYKFMYINSNKTCAVLRATHRQNGTGCELFSTGPPPFVPQDCMDVYQNISNCPNTTSEVWKDDCKQES